MKKILLLIAAILVVQGASLFAQTYTFNYTGGVQPWTVPAGVTSISVDSKGASGGQEGGSIGLGPTTPGKGGRTQATLAVTPGTVMNIYVGGAGATGSTGGAAGGYNGGGSAAAHSPFFPTYCGGGGGGASDIRIPPYALGNRLIIAAGGGGAGYDGAPCGGDQPGGDGGGLVGATISTCDAIITGTWFYTSVTHAGGGTQTAGGVGGFICCTGGWVAGTAGTLGNGGNNVANGGIGAGGGGGLYGGGGGCWTGGGGGSSYTDPTLATSVTLTSGYNSGNGQVIIVVLCTAGAITGTLTLCPGTTTTLADTAGGGLGTWTSSDITKATVGSTTGVVTGVAAGTATITYTITLPCGTVYSTATVTVNPLPTVITGTLTLCPGTTTTLGSTPGGGTWSSSAPAVATVAPTTGVVTGVTPGTSIITYTLVTGCSRSAVVTVNPLPLAITGPSAVCVGSTITLADATGGGTWSSSIPADATVGSATGIVTGVSAGVVTIKYTLTSTGCYVTKLVTVNPLPAGISGFSSICVGDTTFLIDAGGGTWLSSNTAVATVGSSSGMVIGISAGVVTFTYTLPTGCLTTFTMTVNALPAAIAGPTNLCVGATTTYTDATPGGFWTSSDPTVVFIDPGTGLATGISLGVAVITYSAGCNATISVTVNPSPGPITGLPTVCVGSTTSLFALPGGGTWSSSDITKATVGSTSGVVTGIAAGTATITYTALTGCTATILVTVSALPAAIGGPDSVCVGLTVTETDATGGGTWSSSNPAVATIAPGTGVVTGIAPGTVTITYTITGTGCAATRTFYVNSSPAAITGPSSVCVGSTITLSDIIAGGTWASAPLTTATIGSLSGVVTGINPGIATITYSLGAGCSTTTTVNVTPLPAVIAGLSNVCVGATITLTDGTVGGTWSTTSGTVSVGPGTGIVTGISAGPATITYTLGTGCIRTKAITVNPLPTLFIVTGGGSFCAGSTGVDIGLSGSAIGTTYQLYLGVSPVGGAVSGTGSPLDFGIFTAAGTYTVKATTTVTGCTTTMTGSAVITVNPLPTAFTVTGGGAYCAGGAGVHIFLSSSTAGVNYQLFNGVVAVGLPVAGTGAILDFGLQTAAGTYTVVATNAVMGCSRTMTGSVTITINPLPVISGPLALCPTATLTLTATPAGGGWNSGTPAVATINPATGLVTGISTGITNIVYTLPTGCVANVIVTVTPGPTAITGPATVCAGTTVTLTDGVPGGTWTSSNIALATVGSLTGIVTGVAAGSPVTITYSLGSGCIVTKLMTVNASPAPITGILQVCVGNTTTLADPTPGGVWSSTTPAVGTITGIGVVTGISAGTTLISYTVSGCPALATVTVNPLPNPISGTLTVCVGQTTALSDGIPGGAWTSGSPAIATIGTTGIVTGVTPGTSLVTYTLVTGCFKTATVTVNGLPAAILGPNTVCQGLTITETDATPLGTWGSGTPAVATIAGGVVSGITPGTSVITYTIGSTGCQQTKTVTVTPVPSAISGSTGVCVGQTTILSDLVGGGTWTSSNPAMATVGSASGIVTGIAPGSPVITYTVGGCSVTIIVNVVAAPLAITGPPKVCVGGTILKSDATPGGTWSTADPAIATITGTGTVAGITAGTVIISYTIGTTGCIAIAPVVVNPVSQILGTPVVCQGQTAALSDTTLGGTWTSSTPTIATITPLTGIVSGITPGTTTITYTLPTGCTATVTETVNAVPLPITGISHVCVLQTTTLSDPTPGGTWSSSTTAVATISPTGVVTGVSAGITTVSYSLGTGCAATYTVTVNGNPSAITGPTDVCPGGTITLHDGVPAGIWSSSDPTIATVGSTSGVVSGIALGSVTIGYTLGTGCNVTQGVTVDPLPSAITGPASLCVSGTVTLGDPTPGGTWSSSNTAVATISPTGVVTGVTAGITTISYSLGTGCNTTKTVTVNALPVGIIPGTAHVCAGQTTTFTDGIPGGTWSSSDMTIATTGTGAGIVTGVAAGTANIIYTLGTGCNTTATVIVDPLPSAITGSTAICVGSTTTLGSFPAGGTWSSSNGAVAPVTPATGVVSGLSLGTATISYTIGSGCVQHTDVTVNPVPTAISGAPQVCQGQTTTFTDGITGGTWSSSDITIAGAGSSSGVITGVNPGIATITYSLGAGCTVTKDITVNALPSAITGPVQVCVAATITLSDATAGGTWSSSNPAVATVGTGSGIVTGVGAGVVTISYSTACTVTQAVTVNPAPGSISGNVNVCLGGTSALHDSVSGGTWWSTNTSVATVGSVSGIVTGVTLGTATISYILPAGCAVSTVVYVYPLPLVFNVSGGGSYCSGGNGEHIYLSGSTVGVNYLLYRGVTAVGTFAGTGSPLDFGLQTVAGTYTVIGTSTATTCSIAMSGSATIVVIPSVTPSVTINTNPSDTVCAGTSVTFTPIPANGGVTPAYLWDVNGFPVAFSTTYTFIPANGDIVTVTMTSSANCALPPTATGSVTMNVMPYAAPTVSIAVTPNDTVCKGTVVTLTAVPAYGGTAPLYTWMKNGDVAGGSGTFAWIPDNGDFVYAIMQSNYPCRTANRDTSSQVVITVDTPIAPIVAINAVPGTMVQVGQTVTLTAVVTGGTTNLTYQWLKNGIPIPAATNASYSSSSYNYPKPDSVTCMVTSNDICTVTGFQWTYINVANVGVQTFTQSGDITVLPNPNKGEFMIKGSLGTVNDEDVSLEITDILGRVVYKNNVVAKGGKLNEKIVLRSTLANGMYILSVNSASENRVFHMVIEQ